MADEFPEGAPSTDWTGNQLKAYAASKQIDLSGHTANKAEMLAHIESSAAPTPPAPKQSKAKTEDKPEEKSKKKDKCPRCGKKLGDAPRASRVDVDSLVCDLCAQGEDFLSYSQPNQALPPVDQPLWPDPEEDDVI